MGITGLLPLLSSIQKPCNLKAFRGLTLGVDAYVWLHRAAVASAMDIGLGRPSTKFIAPVMNRVRMLMHFGITPYIVFDGDYLPSKAPTEIARATRRAESLKLGNNLLSMGKKSEAQKEFIKAIDITPEMARLLIEELKRNKIAYVVAPYEADAQLAYLERKGLIQGVISEDSDLLVYGIKRLLTKLDEYGDCIEIQRKDFSALKSIHIASWTDADFRRMAILSGCDYLPNIEKIGLKTAYQLVHKYKDIEKILRVLSFETKYTVPQNYLAEFTKAELTFLHQRVYCPERREVIMLTPFEGQEPEEFDFIGKHIDAEIARGVATGELDPATKKEIKIIYNVENYRPSPNILRRSKSLQTPLESKGKTISEFFKPNRVPLAELDPNSFTPSPSQRRILDRHPGSVVSTPVNMIVQRNVSTVASAPAAIGVSRQRVESSGASKPIHKRQRLCAEDAGVAGGGNVKSPFFAASKSDPATLRHMQKPTKVGKELWSDDSWDEALSQLPDDFDTPSNFRRPKIFTEKSESLIVNDAENAASQSSSTATLVTESSASSTSGSEILHSFTDLASKSQSSETHPKSSSKKMTSSFAELAKKYTLTYDSSPGPSKASPLLTGSFSALHTQASKSTASTPSLSRTSSRLSLTTFASTITYPTLPTDPDLETEPKLPLLVPESPNAKHSLVDKPTPKATEDCIVPCSDIESEIEEALAWEEEQTARTRDDSIENAVESAESPSDSPSSSSPLKMKTFGAWNLARFAFTG